MKQYGNIIELNKDLRTILTEQTGLDSSKVLNALSVYGTDLDKLMSEQIYESIEQSDALLLFELQSRDSTDNQSQEQQQVIKDRLTASDYIFAADDLEVSDDARELDDSITYDKAFRLRIIIYGSGGSDIATKLVARLRTEAIRSRLYEQGIYLERVNDPDIVNEYKNETMWLRNDVNIDIAVEFNISQTSTDDGFATVNDMQVITK